MCVRRGAPKGAAEHYFEEPKPIFTKTQFALPTLFPPAQCTGRGSVLGGE